ALELVKGKPLDRAAIPFVKSGKYKDYLDNMSELGDITFKELLQKDPDTGKLIATIKDSAGKEKPAVRKSGFHTLKEFQDAIQGYKDIGKLSYEWTDPLRLMQEMDQGKIAGPVQKQIMWPIHATTEARYLWMDQWKAKAAGVVDNFKIRSSKKAKAVGDVIEAVKDWNDTNENILKIPDVASALRKIGGKNRLDIIEATRQIAKLLEGMRSDINAARKIRGQKEIGEIKGYRPHVREANIWSRWGLEDLKPAEIMDTPGLPDFVRPNQVWFKHALTRKGLLKKYALERNMVKLLGDYIESAGKDIFNTNIIQHMKIHAAVMRDAKMPHAAYAIDRLAAEAFAGTSHWITRGARRVVPEGVLRTISGIRRNLTRAVFPLNFGWNLFVQTTSGALTVARYGATNSLKGLQYFTSRSMNQAVKQNAYSHLTKTRWGGNIIYQDMARSIARTRRLHASKMDRVDQFLDFFTSTIESALTGHAIVSAYHHGKGLGLKGRALWEYASEGGAKTQSMYNHADVPGLLKSRLVGSIVPFQTFAFEIMNTVRELNVIGVRRVVGKTGLYETMSANSATGRALISKRLGMIGRWTAAIIVTNAVADAAIHRKPWKLSSFIPFLGYILNGSPMAPVVGERGQLSVPSSYVGDFYAGVKAVLEYEDWRKLRRWALRYHARAGIQLERVIEGIEVNAENGWVTDVSGKKLFQVPKEEREKMLFTGPWATSAGQEHLTGKGKKKETRTLRTLEK
ncbi:MAG: hypothetical protein ABIJ26_04800, partial [Candidatus Margulisiibacteriota bacterium]